MVLLGIAAAISLLARQTPMTTADIDRIAQSAAEAAVTKFDLKPDQIGISIAVLDRANKAATTGGYHGEIAMYPASVVKLCYLAYTAHLLDTKKLRLTPELERGVHDMIVDSVNDATALVLDTITGTTGGPELAPKELAKWMDKREAVNRWYASLGYPKLNANQKTWNEGPYGRERQGYGPNFELRNSLSPSVCVRLMSDIALDKIVSPEKCEWMRKYLSRDIPADAKETNDQARLFSGKVLPTGTKLWSKAGWTDSVRHDVAWVCLPDGREFVWAIFTKGASAKEDIIPSIAASILAGLTSGNPLPN